MPLTKRNNIAGFKQEFVVANTDDAVMFSILEFSQASSLIAEKTESCLALRQTLLKCLTFSWVRPLDF